MTNEPLRLTAKYGKNLNTRRAINHAIRAELPGGAEALDALNTLRYEGNTQGVAAIEKILDKMDAEIRRRYNLPPADMVDREEVIKDQAPVTNERLRIVVRTYLAAIQSGARFDLLLEELRIRPHLEGHDVTQEELQAVGAMTLAEVYQALCRSPAD